MTQSALWSAFEASWPAKARDRIGPFVCRDGAGGGSRVSATTLDGPFSDTDIDAVEAWSAAKGQDPLFQIRDANAALDRALEARGYRPFDPVTCLSGPIDRFPEVDPALAYATWPHLQVQREIWAASGIGPARIGIMDRVKAPKTTILGRIDQTPLGTCFVACADDMAVVHALDVAPSARRQGLGRAIMAMAAGWARDLGATQMAVQVLSDNIGAVQLYGSLGMTAVAKYHYRTTTKSGPTCAASPSL